MSTYQRRKYPAVQLSPQAITAGLERHAVNVRCTPIGAFEGEIRSGYSGCAFLTGVSKDVT